MCEGRRRAHARVDRQHRQLAHARAPGTAAARAARDPPSPSSGTKACRTRRRPGPGRRRSRRCRRGSFPVATPHPLSPDAGYDTRPGSSSGLSGDERPHRRVAVTRRGTRARRASPRSRRRCRRVVRSQSWNASTCARISRASVTQRLVRVVALVGQRLAFRVEAPVREAADPEVPAHPAARDAVPLRVEALHDQHGRPGRVGAHDRQAVCGASSNAVDTANPMAVPPITSAATLAIATATNGRRRGPSGAGCASRSRDRVHDPEPAPRVGDAGDHGDGDVEPRRHDGEQRARRP